MFEVRQLFFNKQKQPDWKSSEGFKNCFERNETINTKIKIKLHNVAPFIETIGINDPISNNLPFQTTTIATNDFENKFLFGEMISTNFSINRVLLNQANDKDNTVNGKKICKVISWSDDQIIDLSDSDDWTKYLLFY